MRLLSLKAALNDSVHSNTEIQRQSNRACLVGLVPVGRRWEKRPRFQFRLVTVKGARRPLFPKMQQCTVHFGQVLERPDDQRPEAALYAPFRQQLTI